MEPMNKHEEPEDLGEEPVCYMGHVGCWDPHLSERLADEADWLAELERDMKDIPQQEGGKSGCS